MAIYLKNLGYYSSVLYAFICIALLSLLIGCQSDIDTSPPNLLLIQPQESLTYFSGDSLPCHLQMSDDLSLEKIKLQITPKTPFSNAWDTIFERLVAGNNTETIWNLPIPLNIAGGDYTLSTFCRDLSGKRSDTARITITLVNSTDAEKPNIMLTTPVGNSVTIFGGNTLLFVGTISDNNALQNYSIKLYDNITNSLFAILGEETFSGQASYSFTDYIPMPDIAGQYRAEIIAVDIVNNQTQYTVIVNVL